jgi:cobalt-precorrin 5A hydrolase
LTAALFAFTSRGKALAAKLGGLLAERGDRILDFDRQDETGGGRGCGGSAELPLAERAAQAFREADALVFIGAAGIAVRAVAPLVRSKQSDPAVVVIDEGARWAISLLSGHIGGANALAGEIAALLGAQPVITTATDTSGVFAVDLWARRNGLVITSFPKAKTISARLLEGALIPLQSDYPVSGPLPEGLVLSGAESGAWRGPGAGDAGILVSARKSAADSPWLHLVPRIMRLGIGCRRGISETAIAEAVEAALAEADIDEAAVVSVGTIDIKKDEAALSLFCEKKGWPLAFYSSEALARAEGTFSASAFVESVTGADNVCERAAVLASGGGKLAAGKFVLGGVTVAAAETPPALSFAAGEGTEPWK